MMQHIRRRKKEELIKNKELKAVFSNNTKIDVENYKVVKSK